jgi:hypothetical protein
VDQSLENRFWELANSQTMGFGFAPDCESMMRAFISQGVQTLSVAGFKQNEFKIHEAEANLSRFINSMIQEALRRQLTRLQESTFFAAKSSLCPLWPFC